MGFFTLGKGIARVGAVLLRNGTLIFDSETIPTNGPTGTKAGVAGKGSRCYVTETGDVFVNTGTKASPTWTRQPTASTSASVSPSVSPS